MPRINGANSKFGTPVELEMTAEQAEYIAALMRRRITVLQRRVTERAREDRLSLDHQLGYIELFIRRARKYGSVNAKTAQSVLDA
jgi:hypothetical protein